MLINIDKNKSVTKEKWRQECRSLVTSLSEYIAKSGSNVYQLAKEASLDRTTLQKTAKGQRLPSLDYIREICQYIKISSKQEEELVRLYKIEKLGHSTVKAWDEIQQIILDIYQP